MLGSRARRNEAIRRAQLEHGYTLSEMGRALDLHYWMVSPIVNRARRAYQLGEIRLPRIWVRP